MLNLPLKLEHYVSSPCGKNKCDRNNTQKKLNIPFCTTEVFLEYKHFLGEKHLKWACNDGIQLSKNNFFCVFKII